MENSHAKSHLSSECFMQIQENEYYRELEKTSSFNQILALFTSSFHDFIVNYHLFINSAKTILKNFFPFSWKCFLRIFISRIKTTFRLWTASSYSKELLCVRQFYLQLKYFNNPCQLCQLFVKTISILFFIRSFTCYVIKN